MIQAIRRRAVPRLQIIRPRGIPRLQAPRLLLCILCLGSAVVAPSVSRSQIDISLKSQATEWLMQDAPPNPPMKAWLDALSMMIKEKTQKDVPVQIISSVLPSGLVEVRGIVGPNVLVWQVDYPKRKYYSMDKFTSDYMALIAKAAPLR